MERKRGELKKEKNYDIDGGKEGQRPRVEIRHLKIKTC